MADAKAARLVGVGAFVLLCLALFTLALFMIGDRQMAFADKYTVYTEFTKITGIAPGAIIRVSGARAGSVTEIMTPGSPSQKFRVKMEITDDLRPLVRTDSVASIQTEGLVGGSYLSVSTGSEQAPEAPEDSTIPSREPFEIADLMEQMAETVKKVNVVIDELTGQIDTVLVSINDTVEDANALVNDVSDDVKTMASSGARISRDAADIAERIRAGQGTIGKLVNDDELYRRATAIAREVEGIAGDARQVIQQARQAIEGLQSKEGPVQGIASDFRQTLDDARAAMSGFAQNMEALKRNFFFRGFFRDRGYFDLASISPAEYRQGILAGDGDRRPVRVWLKSELLFEPSKDPAQTEQLTDAGRGRLDSAIAPYLDYLTGSVLVVEGYAQRGSRDEQYIRSRARAAVVREYLIGKFNLEPAATGLMPLADDSVGSPSNAPWDGIAVTVFLEREVLTSPIPDQP